MENWADKLATILAGPEAYVAQRFVQDQLQVLDPNLGDSRLVCFGPLFNHGRYIGGVYRDVQYCENAVRAINASAGARYASIRIASV